MAYKKIIGITMGDPASIGPEITVKALSDPALYERCRPLVIGDAAVMKEARIIVGREDIQIHTVRSVSECLFEAGIIEYTIWESQTCPHWSAEKSPPKRGRQLSNM